MNDDLRWLLAQLYGTDAWRRGNSPYMQRGGRIKRKGYQDGGGGGEGSGEGGEGEGPGGEGGIGSDSVAGESGAGFGGESTAGVAEAAANDTAEAAAFGAMANDDNSTPGFSVGSAPPGLADMGITGSPGTNAFGAVALGEVADPSVNAMMGIAPAAPSAEDDAMAAIAAAAMNAYANAISSSMSPFGGSPAGSFATQGLGDASIDDDSMGVGVGLGPGPGLPGTAVASPAPAPAAPEAPAPAPAPSAPAPAPAAPAPSPSAPAAMAPGPASPAAPAAPSSPPSAIGISGGFVGGAGQPDPNMVDTLLPGTTQPSLSARPQLTTQGLAKGGSVDDDEDIRAQLAQHYGDPDILHNPQLLNIRDNPPDRFAPVAQPPRLPYRTTGEAWSSETARPDDPFLQSARDYLGANQAAQASYSWPGAMADFLSETYHGNISKALESAPSALGIFLGIGARRANRGALEEAQAMHKEGVDRNKIWYDTGWSPYGDRPGADVPYWELSDDKMALRTRPLRSSNIRDLRTKDVVQHPDLYANHPQIGRIAFEPLTYNEVNIGNGSYNLGGYSPESIRQNNLTGEVWYDTTPRYKNGVFSLADPRDVPHLASSGKYSPLGTTGHEFGHAAAYYDGNLDPGASTRHTIIPHIVEQQKQAAQANYLHYTNQMQEWLAANQGKTTNDWVRANPFEAKMLTLSNRLLSPGRQGNAEHFAYLSNKGETRSRNIEKRLKMDPAERALTPPWETESIPEPFQWYWSEYPQFSSMDVGLPMPPRPAPTSRRKP